MKSNKRRFTEGDYDFSGVTESEMFACAIYEYARESKAAQNEATSLRNQFRKTRKRKKKHGTYSCGPRVTTQIQNSLLVYLQATTGFPLKPWQSLSNQEKQNLLKFVTALPMFNRHFVNGLYDPPIEFNVLESSATTLKEWIKKNRILSRAIQNHEPVKFGFFAVNLKHGTEALIEEFKVQLRVFEGKPMVEFPPVAKNQVKAKPPGRHSHRDALNALGMLRLRYHCKTFSEAQMKMYALKDIPNGMFYERRDSANRACNLALGHFQKLFGWLDSEKPIHSTDGWRGGTPKSFFIFSVLVHVCMRG